MTSTLAIREIFTDADWVLWGSLNALLPTLAEASPSEFLNAVEHTLRLSPCPFDELFAQEGNGITGDNYLTGLLWALESLAWDTQYLVRVCVLLGELASHDPGGQWSNRPSNSLATILLPWMPQTFAPSEKRKVAVQTLLKEWPDIGWELVVQLLPGHYQTSSGTNKPNWREMKPGALVEEVTQKEYWQQVTFYSELAIESAGNNAVKLSKLIDHFDSLPIPAFDRLIEALSSSSIFELTEEELLMIWDHLTKFTTQHRKFSDSDWALSDELVTRIEKVTEKLAPSNPFNLYQYLFSDRDFDLYDENDDWENQQKKLDERRETAIREIFQQYGIEGVLRFSELVISAGQVGNALGSMIDVTIDNSILPKLLDSKINKYRALAGGFVWKKQHIMGWEWCDKIDKSSWTPQQIGHFLVYLPFTNQTWKRASLWLGDYEGEYWSCTGANAYQADEELDIAIEKLIEYSRPYAAINCLDRMRRTQKIVNIDRCVRALLGAVSSSEPANTMDEYHIVELIKFLQSSPSTKPEDIFKVEWAYLSVLNRHRGASPKILESRLASDPDFFCEVIRLIYRSKNEEKPLKEVTKKSKAIATNAWRLLHEWKIPPGSLEDGSFSGDKFKKWLKRVKVICSETGHLEVAQINIGEVLIHAPADPDGLWIHRIIAEALNQRDAGNMRDGFRTGTYNSRGAHWVDPTGKPEKELAAKFLNKAEVVENSGYQRLAITLRELAESYEREAKRIISEHYHDDNG